MKWSRYGMVLISCMMGCTMTYAQAKPEGKSNGNAIPIDVSVDVNASDLDAELKKAYLLLELREAELSDVNRRLSNEQDRFRVSIDRLKENVEVAKASLLEHAERQRKLEKEFEAGGTNEKALREHEALQKKAARQLENNENALKEVKQVLESKSAEFKLPVERAQIAVQLARNQWILIQEKIKANKSKRISIPVEIKKVSPLEAVGLTKEDLADCKLHVIGLYSATNNQQDDQVFVEIQSLDSPAVIVVSSYYETMWRIKVKDPSQVKLVIMTGYKAQVGTIQGTSKELPLLNLTYFGKSKQINRNGYWAYAYNWPTDEGRKMARMLYEITGLTASTFQGMNDARSLTIDGKRGKLTNRQAKEPIPGLLTAAELAAEPIEFPSGREVNQESSERSMGAVENSLDELFAAEAASKIAMRKIEDEIKHSEKDLAKLENEIEKLLPEARRAVEGKQRIQLVELVRRQFERQQSHRASRVKLSQYKLQLVEIRRLLRERDSEEIVEERIKMLLADESQ
ncbi:MAG: hypothetical protein AAF664_21445 [Planctomycetota bacterium]